MVLNIRHQFFPEKAPPLFINLPLAEVWVCGLHELDSWWARIAKLILGPSLQELHDWIEPLKVEYENTCRSVFVTPARPDVERVPIQHHITQKFFSIHGNFI